MKTSSRLFSGAAYRAIGKLSKFRELPRPTVESDIGHAEFERIRRRFDHIPAFDVPAAIAERLAAAITRRLTREDH